MKVLAKGKCLKISSRLLSFLTLAWLVKFDRYSSSEVKLGFRTFSQRSLIAFNKTRLWRSANTAASNFGDERTLQAAKLYKDDHLNTNLNRNLQLLYKIKFEDNYYIKYQIKKMVLLCYNVIAVTCFGAIIVLEF